MIRVVASLLLLLFAIGCSDDPSDGTPQPPPSSNDAGVVGLPDAQVFPDATVFPDAEVFPDATVETDSGEPPEVDTPITDRYRMVAETFERERTMVFGAPGAALAIIENGAVTFARGFGSKDPGAPNTEDVRSTTLFRIGSVNKVLTTTGLLSLVASGEVSLDAPITTYVPEFGFPEDPSWAPSIVIRHLLTHAGGFYDYLAIEGGHDDASLNSFLTGGFETSAWLMAPPGRFFNYSNPNFYFAGLALERVSGQTYRAAMKERVFDKLGMTRTYFLPSEVIADGDYANALSTDERGQMITVQPDSYENAWARPAGYAFSNVRDLAKFILFLESGDENVLPQNLVDAMQAPQIAGLSFWDVDHYGFGLSVYEGLFVGGLAGFRRIRAITHGGAIPGYAAEIYYVPSLRFGFVTLASTDGAYFGETLVVALRTLTALPPADTPPEFTPDPNDYGRYEGRYFDAHNVGTFIVTRNGNDLTVSAPDLESANVPYEAVLEPYTPNNFIFTVQGFQIELTFILDQSGAGEFMRTRPFVLRKTMMAGLTPLVPVPVDRARLLQNLREANAQSPLRRALRAR